MDPITIGTILLQNFQAILTALSVFINVKATIVGVVVILAVRYFFIPGPIDGEKSLEVIPGRIGSRLLPFIGPLAAFIACLLLEWDKKFTADDVVRGFLSGGCSDLALYFWKKTVKGN